MGVAVMELLDGTDATDGEIAKRVMRHGEKTAAIGKAVLAAAGLGGDEVPERAPKTRRCKALVRRVRAIQRELMGAERAVIEEMPKATHDDVRKACAHVDVALAVVRLLADGRYDDRSDGDVARAAVESALHCGAFLNLAKHLGDILEDQTWL